MPEPLKLAHELEPGDTLAAILTGGPGRKIIDRSMVGDENNPHDPIMVLLTLETTDGSYRPIEFDPESLVRVTDHNGDWFRLDAYEMDSDGVHRLLAREWFATEASAMVGAARAEKRGESLEVRQNGQVILSAVIA